MAKSRSGLKNQTVGNGNLMLGLFQGRAMRCCVQTDSMKSMLGVKQQLQLNSCCKVTTNNRGQLKDDNQPINPQKTEKERQLQ